jgi:hypothetical protein
MFMLPRLLVVLGAAAGLLGCKHQASSPFCPQGMLPLGPATPSAKSLWCASPDKARSQWIEWHDGAKQLRQSCSYLQGKPEGSFTAWHVGGTPWVHGQFSGGVKVGKWKQWDVSGSLVAEGDYNSGRLVAGAPVAAMAGCDKVPRP